MSTTSSPPIMSGEVFTIAPAGDSTIALEVARTGLLRKRKHVFVFENFRGELLYCPEDPGSAKLDLGVDALCMECRDEWLKPKERRRMADEVRSGPLAAHEYPEIRFQSRRVTPKRLRGINIEGTLNLRGVTRDITVSAVISPSSRGSWRIDGDAVAKLSDFGIRPPSTWLGLSGTKDDVTIHLLLTASATNSANR